MEPIKVYVLTIGSTIITTKIFLTDGELRSYTIADGGTSPFQTIKASLQEYCEAMEAAGFQLQV